jgi:hypothetical protein
VKEELVQEIQQSFSLGRLSTATCTQSQPPLYKSTPYVTPDSTSTPGASPLELPSSFVRFNLRRIEPTDVANPLWRSFVPCCICLYQVARIVVFLWQQFHLARPLWTDACPCFSGRRKFTPHCSRCVHRGRGAPRSPPIEQQEVQLPPYTGGRSKIPK